MFPPSDVVSLKITPTIPTASQHVILFDTTQDTGTAVANAAAAQAPGNRRNQFAGYRVKGSILVTTQNVTLKLELGTSPALATSSMFEEDASATSSGSVTITAGTTSLFDWVPRTADWRIRIVAGATPPGAVTVTMMLVPDIASGA